LLKPIEVEGDWRLTTVALILTHIVLRNHGVVVGALKNKLNKKTLDFVVNEL
jgi:hypothetical protein